MKGYFLMLLTVLFCTLANAVEHGNTGKKFEYTENVEAQGVTKDVLFNRASMWVNEAFRDRDAPARVKIQDKENGVIYGEADLIEKQQGYTVSFSLRSCQEITCSYIGFIL